MKDGGWWSSLRNSWIPFSTTLHCCTSKPKTQGKNPRNPFPRYDTIRIMKRNTHLTLHIVIICIVVYGLRLINYIYIYSSILRHLKSWIMAYHDPFRNFRSQLQSAEALRCRDQASDPMTQLMLASQYLLTTQKRRSSNHPPICAGNTKSMLIYVNLNIMTCLRGYLGAGNHAINMSPKEFLRCCVDIMVCQTRPSTAEKGTAKISSSCETRQLVPGHCDDTAWGGPNKDFELHFTCHGISGTF